MRNQYLFRFFITIISYFLIFYYRWFVNKHAFNSIVEHIEKTKSVNGKENIEKTKMIIGIVRKSSKYHINLKNSCLILSLTSYKLLHKNSINATLCIGVMKFPLFRSHAWIELGGEPIYEDIATVSKMAKLFQI